MFSKFRTRSFFKLSLYISILFIFHDNLFKLVIFELKNQYYFDILSVLTHQFLKLKLEKISTFIPMFVKILAKDKLVNALPIIHTFIIFLILTIKIR